MEEDVGSVFGQVQTADVKTSWKTKAVFKNQLQVRDLAATAKLNVLLLPTWSPSALLVLQVSDHLLGVWGVSIPGDRADT